MDVLEYENNCDWHYELRDTYPSIPYFPDKGFRVLPGGWQDIKAAHALNNYAQQHQSERMLGYLCTTWGLSNPVKYPIGDL